MPPHPPRHGDGSSSHIHSGRQLCRGCGVLQANAFVMLHRYSKTHSRDSPSDRLGIRLWGSSRRKPCYVPPTAIPLWEALSASTLRGRQEHSLCLQQINRVLGCTSSYNTPVLVFISHSSCFYSIMKETYNFLFPCKSALSNGQEMWLKIVILYFWSICLYVPLYP